MTVRARLNREDHRRRLLNRLIMKTSRGRNRDVLQTALYEVESRRRWLLNRMTYDQQVVYNRELEERDAARLADITPTEPVKTPFADNLPKQPELTERVRRSGEEAGEPRENRDENNKAEEASQAVLAGGASN